MSSAAGLRAGRATIELSLITKGVEKSLRNLQTRAKVISASFLRIGSGGIMGGGGGFSGFAALRNLFIGSAAATALAWPVKLAANLEVTQARFTALLGDAGKASELIGQLEQFSKIALISPGTLQEGAALLVQYGVEAEKVFPAVKALTEIAAGSEERFQRLSLAYAQVRSRTKLLATEVRQFAESGFAPLEEIAKMTGETIQQVSDRMEQGAVSFQELDDALFNATLTGGRFHNLLRTIGNTASGQFSILRASFALAVRPLGQSVLPALAQFLKAINGAMPAFAAFIKANSAIAIKVLAVLISVAALATTFVSFGLAIQVGLIALGGVIIGVKALIAAVALLLNPLTISIALLGYLAFRFTEVKEAGMSLVSTLSGELRRLFSIAVQTFTGIADALSAGDIALAGEVAMAGLHVAWLEGTKNIREAWRGFKSWFLQTTVDIVFDAQEIWAKFVANVKTLLNSLQTHATNIGIDITSAILKIGQSDETKKAIDQMTAIARFGASQVESANLGEINQQKQDELTRIENNRKAIGAVLDVGASAKEKEAADKLSAAHQRLIAAHQGAALAAAKAGEVTKEEGKRRGGVLASLGAAGGLAFTGPGALFDTRFAKQLLGTPENKQIQILTKIEKNTRVPAIPGVPVV